MYSNKAKTGGTALALALTILGGGITLGCSAGPEGGDQAHDETADRQALVVQALVDLGVAVDDLTFHTWQGMDLVRVGDDLNLSIDELLAGNYEHLRGGGLLVDKAWKIISGQPVSSANGRNIRLAFVGTFSDDQAKWEAAASAWSNATFVSSSGVTQTSANLDMRTSNTGPTITITMANSARWTLETPCGADAFACIDVFPSGTRPSPNIFYRDFLNPFGNAQQCEWTDSVLNRVFHHELGHAIGFTHPGQGVQLPGTSTCSGNGCSTVMASGGVRPWPDCTIAISTLRSDDRDAVTTVY
jgi:hypothetical protein